MNDELQMKIVNIEPESFTTPKEWDPKQFAVFDYVRSIWGDKVLETKEIHITLKNVGKTMGKL